MTIETELKTLVSIYASYDKEKECYISDLNKEALLRLDADFIKLINKLLLQDGPDKTKIKKNYKNLSLNFHPDLINNFIPEAKWIESNLSENRNNGACFKTLSLCYGKLTSPQDFKPIKFDEITTREDLKKWLENLKHTSRTFTERHFYASLMGLLDQSSGYFDEVGKIKPKGIRALISFLPMIFISFSTFVFAEELFAVYALYFALLKSGQFMAGSNSTELQKLGNTLQKITIVSATTTTTLLVRLLEMTFWASRQCYEMSLQIGSTLLTPLLCAPSEEKSGDSTADENLCRELILASQNQSTSDNFKTPELKMIAAPIESYLGLLEQQFFRNWRAGGGKHRALDAFLLRMRVIDKDDELKVEEKVAKASKALELVKKDPGVYTPGGKTALAVDRAERVISLLKDDSGMQLVVVGCPTT
ncbi:TPA: J domain-containing protein [Legionella anisa]